MFLIVGMVVMDRFFFAEKSTFQVLHYCKLKKKQQQQLTLILERRFFFLRQTPKLGRRALTSLVQSLNWTRSHHQASCSLAHRQYFSLFTVSKNALYAQDSKPKCLARITCTSARSAK